MADESADGARAMAAVEEVLLIEKTVKADPCFPLQWLSARAGVPAMRTIQALCLGLCVVWTGADVSAADLRIGVASEVTTLDPHFFHLTSNTEIHKLIYSGLVTQDADMKVIP